MYLLKFSSAEFNSVPIEPQTRQRFCFMVGGTFYFIIFQMQSAVIVVNRVKLSWF